MGKCMLRPPGAYPPQNKVSPDAQQWFNMVDQDRSGKINSSELKAALVNGRGQHFSETACKLMISGAIQQGMFDNDSSGTIDVFEFEKLFQYINQWLQVFKTYDRDGSGHIDESELTQ
ncbi:Peflin, partial [Eumeta japonica]